MAIHENAVGHLSRLERAPEAGRPRPGLKRTLRRVAILGAGTMGARIAAHFANAGVPSLLLSRVKPNEPNRSATAAKAIETAFKQKPGAFFADDTKRLVRAGNYDDNFGEIAGCDWVIETVAENLEIKREIWKRVEAVASPDTIVSTCTSGIELGKIVEGFSPEFRRHFLGTHFFNPTRYMHLLEVIPGPETDPEVVDFVTAFGDRRLGKGVVRCKDTPNFIANRIGCFFGGTVTKITMEDDYTVEEADALTGPLIGLPTSASFRMLDLVGLDIWADIGPNLYAAIPNDPLRDRFLVPGWQMQMFERKWLGEKTGQGFYKKVVKGEEKEIWVIDWKTLEYHPVTKPKFASVEAANAIESVPERVKALIASDDRAGRFLWKLFSDYFLYAASMIPEISDSIADVDRAMRWGYGHKLGPFEMWDALGFQDVACRMQKEGRELPANVQDALDRGVTSLYRFTGTNGHQARCFDFVTKSFEPVAGLPGAISLAEVKRSHGVVKKNAGASLVDLGDGVLCCEFHSKMNAIGEDITNMLFAGLDELDQNYDAMVIANEGENFCVGANLVGVLLAAQEGEWDELEYAVNRLQQVNMALKYASKPVISAPFARTLGGGCEIVLHTIPQASAELYMGQVELGVGLIPAAGGCKELLLRLKEARKAFELIAFAKVSMSAEEAKDLGLLERSTPVSMNADRLIADAKALALAIAPRYVPGVPRGDIKVAGDAAYALLKLGVWTARQGEYISDHDCLIGEKLAYVLAGGRLAGEQLVSEQYLLDLEREAFLSLCGTAKTQERIAAMLKTGKPLRN
jgi:3-hydroxyacyl-CoA dehydrogenase